MTLKHEVRIVVITGEDNRLKVTIRRDDRRRGVYFPKTFSRNRLDKLLGKVGPKDIWLRLDTPALVYQSDKFTQTKQPALF